MARTIYSRPEHRNSVDIDILVQRPSFDEALEVLRELGYVMSRTRRHVTFYEQHHFHLVLVNANNIVIELHWNLSRPEDYCQFDLDGFAARSRSIELDGVSVRIPSDEDQLLHAACQSLRHDYSDLRRVLDAALLLRHGCVDPVLLSELARRQGMATRLWVLLKLQRAMPPPPEGLDWEKTADLMRAHHLATGLAPLIAGEAAPESIRNGLESQNRSLDRFGALL